MTTHRERALGQARADLTALPDLCDELARLIADRHHDITGYRGKVVGSPAPLQLPVVHLTDTRHKPGFHGADPEWDEVFERFGITPGLEKWTQKLAEALPEFPDLTERATRRSEVAVLLEYWPFIAEQPWAERAAHQITKVTNQVKAGLGIRPEYRPTCRKCGSTVTPVDADRRLTSWEACAYGACTGCDWTYPKGPALDALGQSQDPMTLADISAIIGIPVKTLHRWHQPDGLIAPVNGKQRGRVFDLAAVRAVAQIKFGRQVS